MTTRRLPELSRQQGRRFSIEPYLYLLPHAALFLLFTVYPIGYGLYISMHRWDLLSGEQPFVGLEFYRNLFSQGSPQFDFFWRTLLNTTLFTVVSVPLLVGAALGLWLGWGPPGMWLGLIAGLLVAAVLLARRFNLSRSRLRPAAVPVAQ